MHRYDVGVGEPREDLRLAAETCCASGGGELGYQHLDCHRSVEMHVTGPEDNAHATGPDFSKVGIPGGERLLETRMKREHREPEGAGTRRTSQL